MIAPGRCGRRRPEAHQKRRRAALRASMLPASPASWSPPAGVVAQMFGNDRFGCCTKANLANLVVQLGAVEGRALSFTTAEVLASYFGQTGGADNGLCEADVLAEAETDGFCGVELGAVLAIDPANLAAARALCALFGGLYIGAELPASAQLQLRAGQPWSVPDLLGDADFPGTWSGHAMYVAAFDSDLSWVLGTWGEGQRCTAGWWQKYVDEAYVVVLRSKLLTATPEELELLTAILAAAAAEDGAP